MMFGYNINSISITVYYLVAYISYTSSTADDNNDGVL